MPVFTLIGKIKPYVRMTQRSKYSDPQAQEYLASKMRLGLQLRQQMAQNGIEMLPPRTPLITRVTIYEPRGFHNKDLDNQIKAILDAAQGIVYQDDRWVDKLSASRQHGERHETHLWVEVME